MTPRTPQASDTQITELMIPSYANFGGKIHGGTLLSLMDKVAYACATKHAGNYCVTVSVDGVEFLQPVEVGDLVQLMARVNYVGNTSLVVGIKVTAENIKARTVKHTNTCYFTMVAKNDEGKPTTVPPLELNNQEDVRRFAQAIYRKQRKSEFVETVKSFDVAHMQDEVQELLKGQRCIINQ